MAGSNISLYSTTGATNKAIIGTIDWRENVYTPENIHDNVAQTMAHVRGSMNDLAGGWIEYGDGDGPAYTPTYVSGTSFRIDGADVTAVYHVGRRVRLVAASPGTIYGTIATSAFSTNTTLTITWDSGSLSNEAITSVMVSPITATNTNIPAPALPRSHLSGLGTSRNSGTPTTKIDIAVGACRDSTNAANITAASTLTVDCATTGANGLDAGSLANATWYHHYIVSKADGTTAGLTSTSASAPTMPSGYIYKRRVGSSLTDGSAHFIAYSQLGDEFLWLASVLDITSANPGTSAVSRTLSVPTGLQVWAKFRGGVANTGSGVSGTPIFTELDRADEMPSASAAPLSDGPIIATTAGNVQSSFGWFSIRTNTSAQIRSRLVGSDGNCTLYIATFGWIDRRGRDS